MAKQEVILIDDHSLFRLGVKTVITEKLPHLSIKAEYNSGKDFLENITSNSLPDLVILDIIMPEISGVEVAKILKQKYPEIKIIMLSSEVSEKTVERLLDIGVDAYLSKLAVKEDLGKAIRTVLSGQQFFGKDIEKMLYEVYKSGKLTTIKKRLFLKKKVKITITEREEELIKLFCDGLTIKEIADNLTVSPKTVNNHKFNIMQKLGFHSNVELIKYAIRERIVVL